jgi:histone deacetylase complex regulatory component SIN3
MTGCKTFNSFNKVYSKQPHAARPSTGSTTGILHRYHPLSSSSSPNTVIQNSDHTNPTGRVARSLFYMPHRMEEFPFLGRVIVRPRSRPTMSPSSPSS